MKPSSELFDLIRTLTKSEKRFFKLQSSLQSGDKNYVRLFDLIEKMEVYDEELVKRTFKAEKFIKHLPSEKNHLYKLILKSLRSFYSDTSITGSLKQEIKNIEILYNKSLFEECNKFIERAKKTAWKYEKFYYLFELIAWEKLLLEEAYENGQFGNLDALIQEERDVLEKLQNLTAYHMLYSRINFVFRSGGYSRTTENKLIIDEIANDPLIKGKNTALSKRAATICYYTQGFCHVAKGEMAPALEKYQRVKQILDEHRELRIDLAKRYIRTLSQMVLCQLETGNWNEADSFIAQLKQLKETEGFDTIDTISRIDTELILCNQKRYIYSGCFTQGVEAMNAVMEGVRAHETGIHKEIALRMFYYMAYLHFGAGNHKQSLQWLNLVNNDNETDLRQDLYGYARLFNLVVHFELGNTDLLEYTIKSTARYLQKRNREFEVEKLILDQFKKLNRIRGKSARIHQFTEFNNRLTSLAKTEDCKALMRYFDFGVWVQSQLNEFGFETNFKNSIHSHIAAQLN